MITEVLGFSLILPFLPFYAQEMGATPFMVGMLLTTFSLFQFVSAPIMGRLSDIYGRKPLLIISQLSTLASFLILAVSHRLWMLYLSRAVDGLLGSNGTIAQAYLSDISDKNDRSKAFGISGVAFGVGFMIGPAIGGFLSQFGYNLPAYIAAFMSFLSIALTILILPETVKKQQEIKFSFTIIDLKGFQKFWAKKKVRQQLIEFATYALAHILFSSNFAIYADKRIGVTSREIGYALTYVGTISVVMRGFLIPHLIDRFGEKKLEKFGIISMIIGLLGLSLIAKWSQIYFVITFFALGTGLVRPLMMGDVSRSVSDKKQGAILGIAGSINSTAQIIGPLVGGTLLSYCFPNSVVYLAVTLMTMGLFLVIKESNNK